MMNSWPKPDTSKDDLYPPYPIHPSAWNRNSANFAFWGFSEVGLPLYGVLRSSLRIELLLDHRLCWLRGGYRVRMPMHNLPPALFRSKDHRNSQSERRYIFTSADLGLWVLYLHYVGKLSSYMLRYDLDANELAISDLRCGTLRDPSNLIPPMHGRAIGVSEGYVFSTGP